MPGLLKLQQIFHLSADLFKLEMRVVRRISNSTDTTEFLRKLEEQDRDSRKYIVLDCEADIAQDIVSEHIRDTYMNRKNYHFLVTSLVSFHFLSICDLRYFFICFHKISSQSGFVWEKI